MRDSIVTLRNDLARFQTVLSQGSFFSLSLEEKQSLMEDSRKLLHKLDVLAESYLTVGLLGGTGVGKSSLMNALANSEISSTSHRRPHTDHVLIYRHITAELPPALRETAVPWQEITHEVAGIRQIFLCDLPDFDSLVGKHHESVLEFLEHLDVLTWVTSPEKYADGRFHSFLREVPKARQNFLFVLNKADLIFEDRNLEIGYGELAKVTASFQHHLAENSISHPVIYALSAKEVMEPPHTTSPWNQFGSFRHQIFQHRDAKEVMNIKAANLDVEVRHLLHFLEKELADLAILGRMLGNVTGELAQERTEWLRIGREAFHVWLENHFNGSCYSRLDDAAPLLGPGKMIAGLIREWKSAVSGVGPKAVLTGLFHQEVQPVSLKNRLDRLENRLVDQFLNQGLPPAYIHRMEELLDSNKRWEGLLDRLRNYMEWRLISHETSSRKSFRMFQYVTYLFVLLLFLMALGGETAWHSLLQYPEWSHLFGLISSMIKTLFGPSGFAALGTYLFLNFLVGFGFYGRHKKFLQQRTQKFIESLKLELARMWEEELDSIIGRFIESRQEVESQVSALSALHEPGERVVMTSLDVPKG